MLIRTSWSGDSYEFGWAYIGQQVDEFAAYAAGGTCHHDAFAFEGVCDHVHVHRYGLAGKEVGHLEVYEILVAVAVHTTCGGIAQIQVIEYFGRHPHAAHQHCGY